MGTGVTFQICSPENVNRRFRSVGRGNRHAFVRRRPDRHAFRAIARASTGYEWSSIRPLVPVS
jgi:hypothetical protein